MALKAKKPEAAQKRLKLFLFGDYGCGKTTAAVQFPMSYVFDCERGAENYPDLFKKSQSVLLQTVDIDEVIDEIRGLAREKHGFKTVVIDPITTLESDLVEKARRKFAKDGEDKEDMRIWAYRDRYMRQLANLLISLDMNVIVTAHGKIEYGDGMKKVGTTFDGWKRLPYLFDLVVELKKFGSERNAYIRKTRLEQFKDGDSFPFSYAEISKRYGVSTLERQAEPIQVATAEEVAELKHLVGILKVADDEVDKWIAKAQVEALEDLPSDKCAAVIKMLKDRVNKPVAA